jgi:NADH dehydrogenase FAD-containing subunit
LTSWFVLTCLATGVEFSAELHDLCNEDLKRLYPDLIKYVQISIYDVAPNILNMFDKSLADYALEKFKRDGIQIKTNYQTQGLRRGLPGTSDLESDHGFTLTTKQDGEVGVGMCVWSTG